MFDTLFDSNGCGSTIWTMANLPKDGECTGQQRDNGIRFHSNQAGPIGRCNPISLLESLAHLQDGNRAWIHHADDLKMHHKTGKIGR